ncbi:MAG: hypothetical protein QOK43_2911 [Acidimicrobiaceae bacterium]|nr:hypothetical protein [Acidimicrobiaceae bacterium]
MTVLFMGNVCNFAYWFAKWGQALGYDTHALIEDDDPSPRNHPQWEDSTYDPDRPPPWVHFYTAGSALARAVGKPDPRVVGALERFDAVQTFSPAAAMAVDRIGHPQVHHTIGSFARTSAWWQGIDGPRALSPRRVPTVVRFRRAMGRAARIIASTAIDQAEVADSAFGHKLVTIPIAYDVKLAEPYARRRLEAAPPTGPLRLLLPARQHWPFKGQDIVFRGLALLSQSERDAIRVAAFDWGADAARSKALVAELSLGELVEFQPMLSKEDLWAEFARPEVVVIDQIPNLDFRGGALGGVARDALAVGAPVITHAAPEAQLRVHRRPPPVIHTPTTPDGVRDSVRRCLAMSPAERRDLAQAGREWVLAECHYEHVVPAYIRLHEELGLAASRSQEPTGG